MVRPNTSATGCAQSRTRSTAVAAASPPKRSAMARAPPARTPSPTRAPPSVAATTASTTTITALSAVTRRRSSLTLIQIPLRVLRRPKQAHEPRRDPQAETDQKKDGARAEPSVRVVPAGEPDHRREHHRHSDRGKLADGLPGRFARRHVKTNTSTSVKLRQGKAQCLSEHPTHTRPGDAVDHEHGRCGDDEEDDAERGRFAGAARDVERKDAHGDRLPASEGEEQHRRGFLERRHEREERADED